MVTVDGESQLVSGFLGRTEPVSAAVAYVSHTREQHPAKTREQNLCPRPLETSGVEIEGCLVKSTLCLLTN